MINPYVIIAALIFYGVSCVGSGRIGWKLRDSDAQKERAEMAEKVVVRERVITKEVPKIVTKVVEKRVEVEKEVERVVTVIPKVLAPDCVLPDGYGFLLVAAANGIDPTTARGASALTGAYDCRASLAAVLTDLEAGWVNTERLRGLQAWAELVTKETP